MGIPPVSVQKLAIVFPLLNERAKRLSLLDEFFRLGLRDNLGGVRVEDGARASARLTGARQG